MRKLKLLSLLMLICFSVGNVWGGEESVTISPTQALNDGGVDPIAIVCAKGDGTSNPAISSGQLRLYQAASGKTTGNTITFSSTYSITSIVFTFNGSYTASNGVFSEGDYDADSKTWSGSSKSLTLTCTGTTSGKRIYIESMTVYYETGGGTPTCATPTFSPAAGSYEGTQNVTISSTAGATIYYTTDDSDPTTSGTRQTYSSPIAVSADMTIKAYAVKDSYNDSEVATAAYEITEGPDETIAFEGNTDWDIPVGSSSKTVDEGTYTDGTYTIKIAGSTGEGYYINGYLLLGKTGAYVELPEFSNPVEKIVVVGTTGGSTGVKFNIYDGTTAVSTEVTGCKNVSQEFEIADPAANKAYKVQVTSNANLQISAIKIYFGAAATVNKPTISGDEKFVTSTSVSLACTTSGADIYYTLNGSDPQLGGATKYSAPFSLTEDATVNARAKLGDDWSGMVSKTFTKVTALATMAEVQAAAETTEKTINVSINNWVVTAVSGSQVWFADADNAKGILLYKSSHGFTAGKKLNGTVIDTKIKLYNLYPELTSLVASEVTVTDAETVSPRSVTIPTLNSNHPAEQGTIVKLENVTYSSSTSMLSDGVNSIAADNKFYSSLALIDGTTYNITGVVTYYKESDAAVVKIAPRTADDVEATSAVVIPTAANLAALKAAARGTYILTLTNAVVTYVNGNNAFIEDATGGALIYFASHGYSAGDCLNGDYQVVTTDYQGKFEITAMEPQAGAATTTAEIPLTTVSIATLNADFAAYESKRIKIAGANVTDAISGSDRNGVINDGAALAVYAAVASTITLTADDNVDIIGYPGFHNTDQQLTVWAQADITVNVKEDPELEWKPSSREITYEAGVTTEEDLLVPELYTAASFGPSDFALIEFSSDNTDVATVSSAGVISWKYPNTGVAHITAHFPGNETFKAEDAICTIMINDPASVDTRKIAESPAAGFSSIEGDLSGNEISYAAYKGGASSAPNANNTANELRLYKYQATTDYGGYVTITAKTGCTIDQVVITVSANCNVGYCKDAEELPTKENTPIAIGTSSPFDTGTGLNASSVSVVNLDASNQFKIKSITVYYTGEAATLQSIAISGTASVLEYNDGDEFDPAGLVVTGHYSDNTDAEITDGITWAFDPATLSEGDASVSVTATVGEITSAAFVVNGLTVSAAAASTTDNVVILATYGTKLYAMSTTLSSSAFTAIEVEEDGSNIVVPSAEAKAAIQWTRSTSGENTTFQDADGKYMAGGTGNTNMSLADDPCNWGWNSTDSYYYIGSRSFFYYKSNVFKNYSINNAGGDDYSGFAEVRAIDPANIVVTTKADPQLAYDPTSVELTVGGTFTPATLTYATGFDGLAAVTYESSNIDLATVEGGVVSLVANATGTTTITATFPGNDNYQSGSASYTITVNEAGDDLSGTWTRVTSVAAGQKIIIAGTYNSKTMAMGKQNSNNRAAVLSSLDGDVLTPGAETKVFTLVDAGEGLFAIQASNGKYLNAAGTGSSNYLKEAEDYEAASAKWTVTFDENGANIVATSTGNRNVIRYNSTNNSELFSCYAAGGQRAINIYSTSAVPPTPSYTDVRTGLTDGNYYTVCWPKAMTAIKGGTLWSFVGRDANFAYIEQVNAPFEAGKPYILYATANKFEAVQDGTPVTVAGENNGLHGTFVDLTQESFDAPGAQIYLVIGNQLRLVTGQTGNTLPAYRAYVELSEIPDGTPAPMPGRQIRSMALPKNTPTGMDQITNDQMPITNKVIIDGRLFILRGEKMYDATGRLVK